MPFVIMHIGILCLWVFFRQELTFKLYALDKKFVQPVGVNRTRYFPVLPQQPGMPGVVGGFVVQDHLLRVKSVKTGEAIGICLLINATDSSAGLLADKF